MKSHWRIWHFLIALTPFWDSQDSFWISTGTEDTSKLGYTYPDFNGLDMGNADAVKTAIGNLVNTLYGSSIFGSFAAAPTSTSTHGLAAFAAPAQFAASLPPTEAEKNPDIGTHEKKTPAFHVTHRDGHRHGTPGHIVPPNHGLYDWTARVEFKKYELATSFSVLVFLGTVPEDPNDWLVSPNFVGAHHAFVNSKASACANCRSQSDIIEEGFVHLNRAIAKHSGLESLNPDTVVPYLTKELHWRVLKVLLSLLLFGFNPT